MCLFSQKMDEGGSACDHLSGSAEMSRLSFVFLELRLFASGHCDIMVRMFEKPIRIDPTFEGGGGEEKRPPLGLKLERTRNVGL